MARQIIDAGNAPILWSTVEEAFRNINQNFTEIYATIAEDLSTQVIDFSTLYSDVSPGLNEVYDLGAASRRWKDLYLSGSTIYLGSATITANGTSVELPIGSTIGGAALDNTYFKEIAVAGQSNIIAEEGGTDILTISAGNSGITLTTNPTTDTLTISNSGVTSLSGTAGQIGVSTSTGSITLSNLGVTSIIAGFGMSVNQATGAVTVTNEGLAGLDAGIGITLSPRDPITGRVTVTNSQPNVPQNVFATISVPTQSDVVAENTADTLNIEVSGDGLSITTNALTDTITFANTGVHSLAVGNGLTASAGTGSINLTLDATLSRNIIGDLRGSVFADSSTLLVDATGGRIPAEVVQGTFTGNVVGSLNGTASIATTVTLVATESTAATHYITFVDTTTGNENVRTDSALTYNPSTNTITAGTFATGTLTITGSIIGTTDSSGITVNEQTTFNTDVAFENDITVAQRLIVNGSRVINLTELKAIVAASSDFNNFKTRIAAL